MSGFALWNKFLVWTVAFTLLSLFQETQGFDETSVDSLACKEQPCGKEEAGECNIYHQGSGCSQCANGYFKLSSNHACVDCQEFFGSECLHCSDGNGCQQCTSNGYFRQEANYKNLTFWYCDDDVCNDESSHCKTCNNGECSQCMSGYFRMLNSYDQYECLDCSNVNVTGEGCLHCSDFNGCQQCQDGYALKHKKNKKNGMIYNQCVEDKPPS